MQKGCDVFTKLEYIRWIYPRFRYIRLQIPRLVTSLFLDSRSPADFSRRTF